MSIPKLDSMYCRNAHILYSAQTDYIGPKHHKKNVEMFDADEKGNLYVVGLLKRIWINFISIFTGYEIIENMNCRVERSIVKTIKAIEGHFDRLSQFWKDHEDKLNSNTDLLKEFNKQLYIFPNRGLRVEKVNWESLFLLNLENIKSLPWEYIMSSRPLTHPLGDLKQTRTLQIKYLKLEEKIIQRLPELDLIKILCLNDSFQFVKDHVRNFEKDGAGTA